jgi:NAD(P)-dependent dehydrogenase (short-subunit alcohol dehydrogenase family)
VRGADVEEAMAVNFAAAARGTLAVLDGMRARQHVAVVNVSSDHGRAPGPGTPAYCASKAAISAFTESLAHELVEERLAAGDGDDRGAALGQRVGDRPPEPGGRAGDDRDRTLEREPRRPGAHRPCPTLTGWRRRP